jgi:hypothetical protein
MQYRKDNVWPSATDEKCQQFIACLNNEQGVAVKVLTSLAKALEDMSQSAFIEYEEIANESLRESNKTNCFTPTKEKYKELTECNCMKGLVHECGNDAGMDPMDKCLIKFACKSEKVCDAWQAAHCTMNSTNSLQQRASSVTSTSEARDKSAALETRAQLDDTLQSKCA